MPSAARKKRADLSIAIEAADELAGLWKEREFPFKQPYHVSADWSCQARGWLTWVGSISQVLCFPTLIPKDLPHLARQLDFDRLVSGLRTAFSFRCDADGCVTERRRDAHENERLHE